MEKLKMCGPCKNQKCKDEGYKYLMHCQHGFMWAIFGICAGALFILTTAAYLITRIADNQWGNWKLPVILIISYLVIVIVGAMFCSIRNIKEELSPKKEDSGKAVKKEGK